MDSLQNGNHDLNQRIMNEKAEYDGFGKQRKKKRTMVEKIIKDFQKIEYKFLVSLSHKYYECNMRHGDTFRCIRKKISQLFRDYERASPPKKKQLSVLPSAITSSSSTACTDMSKKRLRYIRSNSNRPSSTSEESIDDSTFATTDEGVICKRGRSNTMDNEASMKFALSPAFEVFSEKFCVEDMDNLSISSDANLTNDDNEDRDCVSSMPPLKSDHNLCETNALFYSDSFLSEPVLSWSASCQVTISYCKENSTKSKYDNEYVAV